jgi:hypothetical protein
VFAGDGSCHGFKKKKITEKCSFAYSFCRQRKILILLQLLNNLVPFNNARCLRKKISHDGSIYTMEMGKHYKTNVFLDRPWLMGN